MTRKTFKLAAAAAILALTLSACASDPKPAAGEKNAEIKIGVVGSQDEQWPIFEKQAKEAGFNVKIVNFSAYSEPNPALTQGQLQLNQFQHLQYLADYNVSAKGDLVPIGATAIYPLALYSKKHKAVAEIPDGSEIAVPNDPTNLSRALLVLQDAGLLKLKDGGTSFSTEIDVIADESRVKVTPIDASQSPSALTSVAAAIINNDFLTDAGLKPEDALYQDNADSPAARPYINVWVARAADKDNADYLKLVEIFHSAEVEKALQDASGGTAVNANQTGAELTGWLKEIETNLEAQN